MIINRMNTAAIGNFGLFYPEITEQVAHRAAVNGQPDTPITLSGNRPHRSQHALPHFPNALTLRKTDVKFILSRIKNRFTDFLKIGRASCRERV